MTTKLQKQHRSAETSKRYTQKKQLLTHAGKQPKDFESHFLQATSDVKRVRDKTETTL